MNFSTFIIAAIILAFTGYQAYHLFKKRGQACNDCDCGCAVKSQTHQHRKSN